MSTEKKYRNAIIIMSIAIFLLFFIIMCLFVGLYNDSVILKSDKVVMDTLYDYAKEVSLYQDIGFEEVDEAYTTYMNERENLLS